MKIGTKILIPLIILQTGLFTVMCIANGYFAAMYSGLGYDEAKVGVIYTIMGGVSLIIQPLIGSFFDRTRKYRLLIILMLVQYSVMIFVFMRFASITLIGIIFCVSNGISGMLIDSVDGWVKRLSAQHTEIVHPRVRGYGSFVYAFAALGVGYLLRSIGVQSAKFVVLIAVIVAAVAALFVPNPTAGADEERVSLSSAIKYLMKDKPYLIGSLCMFLFMFTGMATIAYLPFLNESIGGTSVSLGYVIFITTFAEATMMLFFRRLTNRFGVTRVLAFGILGHFLRCICFALAPNVGVLLCVSVLQAVSWGITIPGWATRVFDTVKREYFATAVMLSLAVAYNGSQLIGGWLFGAVADAIGVKYMLLIMSLPALAAFIIFYLSFCRRKADEMQTT